MGLIRILATVKQILKQHVLLKVLKLIFAFRFSSSDHWICQRLDYLQTNRR